MYSRNLVGTCAYTVLCIRIILNAEREEAEFGHAIATFDFPSLNYTNVALSSERVQLHLYWRTTGQMFLLENNSSGKLDT